MKRKAKVTRETKETKIGVDLELISLKESKINSGVPFLDHMLSLMAKHGRFWLKLDCQGDVEIDDHHSVEDIGLALGEAFRQSWGQKQGIKRFGTSTVPMDEVLVLAAVDLSGRSYFKYTGEKLRGNINTYSEELTLEFLRSLATKAEINLHVNLFYGLNRHHIHEAIFKAVALAIYEAVSLDEFLKDKVLSTKGSI